VIRITERISKTLVAVAFPLGLGLLVATWAGCGADASLAPVSGTVTADGQPVQGGVVTFAPIQSEGTGGKPAVGEVGTNGTFQLGTNAAGDGAAVGRHRVIYSAPTPDAAPAEEGKHAEAPPASPYEGLMPKEAEVEVKAGPNQIDIELVAAP
jgi:hypothetical protein